MKFETTENRQNVANEYRLFDYTKGEAFIQPGRSLEDEEVKEILNSDWMFVEDIDWEMTYSLNGNSLHLAC